MRKICVNCKQEKELKVWFGHTKGYMNWSLKEGWKCEICGNDFLIWGLVHATCRCNKCHTQYRMRDEKDKMVDTPICQLKPKYHKALEKLYPKLQKPINEITEEEWESELNEKIK